MTKRSEMTIAQADARAQAVGAFVQVSALGGSLVFYTGNLDDRGTWLEMGKIAIRNGNVSIKAVDAVLQ